MVLILLLEVRQRPRPGGLSVWGAAHVGADGGLDLLGLPAVGLQIASAHHDVLSLLSSCHGRAEVDLRAADDASLMRAAATSSFSATPPWGAFAESLGARAGQLPLLSARQSRRDPDPTRDTA